MNPGPFGMAQTGVPFGEVGLVRDWLGIDAPVGKPRPRASEAAGRGLRVHAERGLGTAALGLRARSLREARALLRAFLRRELLPAALPRSERPQPHAGQAARRRARAARARLRSRAAPDDRAAAAARSSSASATSPRRARAMRSAGLDRRDRPHPAPEPGEPAANRGWAQQAERAFAQLGVDAWESRLPACARGSCARRRARRRA